MSPINNTDTDAGRFYTWKDEKFWSVTTIINGGVPKPALVNWAAKFTAEFAVENVERLNDMLIEGDDMAAIAWLKSAKNVKTETASALGTEVHAAVEAYTLDEPYETSSAAAPYVVAFQDWLEDFSPTFEMVEASVYNRYRMYAGTLDAIATVKGVPTLIDYKSGKGVYPEVALQLAAYRNAEFVGVGDEELEMPETEAGAVLHLTPNGYVWIPVKCDSEVFQSFLYAREIHRWSTEDSKSVLSKETTKRKPVLKAVP